MRQFRFYPILENSEWLERMLPLGVRLVGELPLVAIGGMQPDRAAAVFAAGADVISVVTDITLHPDPEARTREWLQVTRPEVDQAE